MDLFSSQGGTALGGMLEAFAQVVILRDSGVK
jgi:hypothetical protein